jgi:protein phosphatase
MTDTSPSLRPVSTASLTDVGRVRKVNQDHCGELTAPDGGRLLVLCDGMGGHSGGEIASHLAVETIVESVGEGGAPPDQLLRRAFDAANERIKRRGRENPQLRGMGTTGVALYLGGDGFAWVAHVGDSRAYRLRNGKMQRLTDDHSLVAEQLRSGLITAEEAERLPKNELLRAIGQEPPLKIDIARHDVREGDRFLLCSDGLWNVFQDDEIAFTLGSEAPAVAVRKLVDRANERGSRDNVTVQILVAAAGGGDGAARGLMEIAALDAPSQKPAGSKDATVWREDVDVDEIWSRAGAQALAQRDRRIRRIAAAAVIVGVLLAGMLLWLRSRALREGYGQANQVTPPAVAAPPPADAAPPPAEGEGGAP